MVATKYTSFLVTKQLDHNNQVTKAKVHLQEERSFRYSRYSLWRLLKTGLSYDINFFLDL